MFNIWRKKKRTPELTDFEQAVARIKTKMDEITIDVNFLLENDCYVEIDFKEYWRSSTTKVEPYLHVTQRHNLIG